MGLVDLENVRLPRKGRQKRKTKAPELYGRGGRTNYGQSKPIMPPVSLDPEAMQQVLQDLILSQHRDQLEQRQVETLAELERMRLPQPDPQANMPPQ